VRKYFVILLNLVLLTFMIGSSTSTFADGIGNSMTMENPLETTSNHLMNYSDSFEDVNSFDEKTLSDFSYRDFEQGLIDLNSEGELDFEKAFVKKMKDSGEYTVRIPIIHENYEVISGITVVYDSDRNFEHFIENIVYEDSGIGYLKTWKNNELQDEHSINIEEFEEDQGDISLQGKGWGCIKDCLNKQGLPTWVLGLVGTACAAICVGTAGVGCAICIQGLGLGYIGIFEYCLKKCGY